MRVVMTLLACLTGRAAVGQWTPPANPNPQTILREAVADARARNYESALAKQVWFHEHALEFDQGQYGVRLSFALSYWMDLAKAYPPALEKLKAIRDATQRRLDPTQGGKPTAEDFHDLASINKELDENDGTVAAFQLLDKHDAKMAQREFRLALPALVQAKEYKLCGKYVDSKQSIATMIELHQMQREMADRLPAESRERLLANGKEQYVNDASTLVAILAVNERQNEAEKAALALRKVEGDAAFQSELEAAMEKALEGKFPDSVR